ncbi:MAG TPA: hypothetical protein VHX39_31580 [Acetobacteraceae bacterium]|jgi:hypothetical protein|nr:hypothetical protein [Acetobacteraceae bacterium]
MRVVIPDQLAGIVTPVHPLAEEADQHAIGWAHQHGLASTPAGLSGLAAIKPGTLAAHCYPAAVQNDLFLLADWLTWLFSFAEQNDSGEYGRNPNFLELVLTDVYFAAVEPDGPIAENPLGTALKNIFARIGGRMPVEWRRRFLCHVIDYFAANIWQAAHRRTGDIPDLDTFASMRRDVGGIIPSFDLIELVASTTIPAELYCSRVYQRLIVSAANVVCWTNDLMTAQKDLANGRITNFVPVLMHHLAAPVQDSIDDVTHRVGRQVELFIAAERELVRVFDVHGVSDERRTATLDCVAMLRAWMGGHVEWGRNAARHLQTTP